MGEVQKQPTSNAAKGMAVLVIVVLGVFMYGCTHKDDDTSTSSTPTTYSQAEVQASVVDTCQDAVRKSLKDPDSAKFGDDWKAWYVTSGSKPPVSMTYDALKGDQYWNAGGTVNGKNSYGAYAGGEDYYCDVVVTKANDIHAQARPMSDLLPANP